MKIKIVVLIFLSFYFSACSNNKPFSKKIKINDAFFKGDVTIEKIEKLGKNKISIYNKLTGKGDRIYTPYEVFQMETGDVNNDGKTDICIGIIKPTPFDSILKKRLFIFQIDRDYIRPLWLSSRLVKPLEEFIICKKNHKYTIKAMEKENNHLYCINEYRWESFGMSFLKEQKDSLTYSDVKRLLHESNKKP